MSQTPTDGYTDRFSIADRVMYKERFYKTIRPSDQNIMIQDNNKNANEQHGHTVKSVKITNCRNTT